MDRHHGRKNRRTRRIAGGIALALSLGAALALAPSGGPARADTITAHGLSLTGETKYPPGFAHFDYVNPDAPKGGATTLFSIGGFDSLNPFIAKGNSASGLGLVFDTLMANALDEPNAEYGLVARTVTHPADFSWVEFELRPEARFHDGEPVTAEDVVFSFETLRDEGQPFYRLYYANVTAVEALGPHRVRFTFDTAGNRELPVIMGQLPVLPKHWWEGRAFGETTLEPPLGSGPYRVAAVDANRSITYERVPDYWAKDLNVNVGANNFDRIRYDYFRDMDVAFEAFKGGSYDFRSENSARRWATGYDFDAVQAGDVTVETIPDRNPQGMQGFVMNLRRAPFDDVRVREAFNLAFDFHFANETLFYGQYARTRSYFEGSELAATGVPEGDELALLEPFRAQLPEEVFTTEYHPPETGGRRGLRENLRKATELLNAAGWTFREGALRNAAGEALDIEVLLISPDFERVVAPYVQNLERLGIKATIRIVDTAQYIQRLNTFDYDMIVMTWGQSLSPGNEQRNYWSCAARDREGSRNYAGICDPVIDALIDRVIFAQTREELVAATRALDRVLQWGRYVVPHWHFRTEIDGRQQPAFRLAYWNRITHPETLPPYTPGYPTVWWSRAAEGRQ